MVSYKPKNGLLCDIFQMCTSLESLHQSLMVVQNQMSSANDEPLSLNIDDLRQQINSHDTLIQSLTVSDKYVQTVHDDSDQLTRHSAGNYRVVDTILGTIPCVLYTPCPYNKNWTP